MIIAFEILVKVLSLTDLVELTDRNIFESVIQSF